MKILDKERNILGKELEQYLMLKIGNCAKSYLVFQTKDKDISVLEIDTSKNSIKALGKVETSQLIITARNELIARQLLTEEDVQAICIDLENEWNQRQKTIQERNERYTQYLEYMQEFDPESYAKKVVQHRGISLSKEQQNNIKDNAEKFLRNSNLVENFIRNNNLVVVEL